MGFHTITTPIHSRKKYHYNREWGGGGQGPPCNALHVLCASYKGTVFFVGFHAPLIRERPDNASRDGCVGEASEQRDARTKARCTKVSGRGERGATVIPKS